MVSFSPENHHAKELLDNRLEKPHKEQGLFLYQHFRPTTGITVCLMIFLFVMNEFSFDNFHKNGKDIYRVMRSFDASKSAAPWLSGPYAPALLNDFRGEIKQTVRIMPDNDLVTYKGRPFN